MSVTAGEVVIRVRANLTEFKSGMTEATGVAGKATKDMAESMDYSMREARGSMMLLEHEMGIKLPREINTLLASVPGIGLAFEALLPIMAAVFAAKMIYDMVEAHKKAITDLAEAWQKFGNDSANSLRTTADKILGVQIQIDELTHNHMKALREEIQLIDDQTLEKIGQEFNKLAADADATFDKMKVGFTDAFLFGSDNAGVKAVKKDFDDIQQKINEMRAAGDNAGIGKTLQEAHDSLRESIESEPNLSAQVLEAKQKELAVITSQLATYKEINTLGSKEKELHGDKEGVRATEEAKKAEEGLAKAVNALNEDYRKLNAELNADRFKSVIAADKELTADLDKTGAAALAQATKMGAAAKQIREVEVEQAKGAVAL